jgi:hypothetical protein
MSNPLVAPTLPLTAERSELSRVPQAYFTPEEASQLGKDPATGKKVRGGSISIERVNEQLESLDLDKHYSFYLGPENLDGQNQARLAKEGRVLAHAQMGSVSVRHRTQQSMLVAGALYSSMNDWGDVTKEAVRSRAEDVVYVQAGTASTLGRLNKYYPKKGSKIAQPITHAEVAVSLKRCGLTCPEELRGQPYVFEGDGKMISVNPDAENGYPVGGKWSDELTHKPIFDLASQMRKSIVEAFERGKGTVKGSLHAVVAWKRTMEDAPETLKLVALKGKCKADPYKKAKVLNGELRFYNVFPRQVLMNIMMVTQVVDDYSLTAGARDGGELVRTAIGATLTRGGADKLVEVMDDQLKRDGYAYLHVGDDSFVALTVGDKVALFSIDCSSFDLTQHAELTHAVHLGIYEQLRKIDGPAAALWYAYARERCCVVVNSQVYRMRHAGPSGFPLQSKINDLIMDVYLRRLARSLAASLRTNSTLFHSEVELRKLLDSAMQVVGGAMGLVARLEDFVMVDAESIREALGKKSFLFIGYRFYQEDGRVYVFADLVRQLGQMQYPNSFWVERERLNAMEAVRLAGILISMGRPPQELRAAYDAARKSAATVLGKAIKEGKEELRWLPENAFVGVSGEDVKSLSGLMAALNRDPNELWGFEGELQADSYLVGKGVTINGPVEGVKRGIILLPKPTHPITDRNHGRPPPVARWGPPKPPRYQTTYEKVRGFERAAGYEVDQGSESGSEFMDPDYYGFEYRTLKSGRVVQLWGSAVDRFDEMEDDWYSDEGDNDSQASSLY